ncbi:MAG: glycoside hydrolase family 2 TIM barrel-domain containing protein [Draconibacterium sp.]
MRYLLFLLFYTGLSLIVRANNTTGLTKSGFIEIANSGREVLNMNQGWRFHKGEIADASQVGYDDSEWEPVTLPHGLELLPAEASGCVNYQGPAWYRKTFVADPAWEGKKVFIHFEAIMGKSKIWLNGKLLKEHYGGYLPVIVDVSELLLRDKPNVIAVWADNSDDPAYPPGKPQRSLDFAYFGGMYRDCFLVVHNPIYITDPNVEYGKGGINLYYSEVSEKSAKLHLYASLRNETKSAKEGKLEFTLTTSKGGVVKVWQENFSLASGLLLTLQTNAVLLNPDLWSPQHPVLHDLTIVIKDKDGKMIDGYKCRTGIREIELKGADGLWLNGEPYNDKLIGVNRHQEFAVIGNTVPNRLQYRDVKKLRDAGVTVMRCPHYPQDPAFLDACDAFGVFVILPTAGWQFWNNDPVFAERIYSDIRQMVRRDRNHPSLLFWEPVLNETHFPKSFAKNALQCVAEEAGGNLSFCATDPGSEGSEYYPVIFSHPQSVTAGQKSSYNADAIDSSKVYFTREFGDNVDDWSSHNSNSRASRAWGEQPMLIQAQHYAAPEYTYTCWETLYESGKYHIGGTLWHAFDHQRGYHPNPFYGGIMDQFRQPKTAYYMFKAQRPVSVSKSVDFETGPMIYIANEMTPFSGKDVVVYSNCEEVKLTVFKNGDTFTYHREDSPLKMPSPIITFRDAYDFMKLKALTRAGKHNDTYILAEGLVYGKVVVSQKRYPSFRPTRLQLRVDDEKMGLIADGSDVVTVIAEVVDQNGTVKRLDNHIVRFSIEGEGRLLFNEASPVEIKTEWGSAPVLVKSTNNPGKITIRAEIPGAGIHSVQAGECVIETQPSSDKFVVSVEEQNTAPQGVSNSNTSAESKLNCEKEVEHLEKEIKRLNSIIGKYEIKEVEKQQEKFGEHRK